MRKHLFIAVVMAEISPPTLKVFYIEQIYFLARIWQKQEDYRNYDHDFIADTRRDVSQYCKAKPL